MLTADYIATLDEWAGADRLWNGAPKSTERFNSYCRKAFRIDLIERQGGMCPVCGNALRFPQFNHVVSRGPKVRGFIEGNIFAGCALCNLECALEFGIVEEDGNVIDGGVIPITKFKRPDLIPFEWTSKPILKARQAAGL